MKEHILIIMFLILPALLKGDSGKGVKSGLNVSSFLDNDRKLKLGVTFGYEKEWKKGKNRGLSFELMYATRGGIFENKIIGLYDESAINYYSQTCSVGFLDIPILFHYYILNNNSVKWDIYLGPSLSLAITDNSEQKKIRTEYYYPEGQEWPKKPKFDYYWNEESFEPLDNSTFFAHLGFGFKWASYHLEVRFSLPASGLNSVRSVKLHGKKYATLSLTLGAWIPKLK